MSLIRCVNTIAHLQVRIYDQSVKIVNVRHCTLLLCEKSDSYVVGCWSNEVQIKWSFAIRHAASRFGGGALYRPGVVKKYFFFFYSDTSFQ